MTDTWRFKYTIVNFRKGGATALKVIPLKLKRNSRLVSPGEFKIDLPKSNERTHVSPGSNDGQQLINSNSAKLPTLLVFTIRPFIRIPSTYLPMKVSSWLDWWLSICSGTHDWQPNARTLSWSHYSAKPDPCNLYLFPLDMIYCLMLTKFPFKNTLILSGMI